MGKYCRKHIGKKFNNGNITVIDGGDKDKYVKVKCIICCEDEELFGTGIFETAYTNLTKGQVPCGCSSSFRWSLDQYAIRITRKIKEQDLPIQFLGFGKVVKPLKNTAIKLFCNKERKSYEVCNMYSFFVGSGNFGKNRTSLDERLIEYNRNNPNYTVWNTGNKVNSSEHVLCGFYCKICESKGYDSFFETSSISLYKGQIPCYCSNLKVKISVDHIIEESKRILYEEGTKNCSVLYAYKKGGDWQTVFLCEIHGVYSRRYCDLKRTGCYCTKCAPPISGYNVMKKGYLYLLEIFISDTVILGYGVTNNYKSRLTTHRRNLKSIGATITNIQIFEGSGTAILDVENSIKSLHQRGLIDCEGFRRESISIDRKAEVLEKCKKLKEIDNIDKVV